VQLDNGVELLQESGSVSRNGISRRAFLGAACAFAALASTGCAAMPERIGFFRPLGEPVRPRRPDFGAFAQIYGEREDNGFLIPAVDLNRVPPQFLRQVVPYETSERVGTVIVDTAARHLYLVQEGGMAIRYGVGIGREGFEWSGRARIQWKQPWPRWTPPDSMIARQPELARYIFKDGVDTLYRIHGTPEYWTIGKAVSSGCVRMMNQDVIDLYDRVPNGTPILVM
jgi:lipoprotein-anchoring transpeptidase ErfK/SrfK